MTVLSAVAAALAGAVACPLYVLLRLLAVKARFRVVSVALDAAFGALCAATVALIAFLYNDGIVKLYMILFFGCGYVFARLLGALSVDIFRRKR